jgi:hypothetical protein
VCASACHTLLPRPHASQASPFLLTARRWPTGARASWRARCTWATSWTASAQRRVALQCLRATQGSQRRTGRERDCAASRA